MLYRILTSIFLFISIFFLPFWVSVILGVISIFYFNFFVEIVFIFLIMDLFYGIPEIKFGNIPFVASMSALLVLLLLEYFKKGLKFYNKLN